MAHKVRKKFKNPTVITANLVVEGDSVYLDKEGLWNKDINLAEIAHSAEEEVLLLAKTDASVQAQYALGVYAIEVQQQNDEIIPLVKREMIRADLGPTIIPNGLSLKNNHKNQYTEQNIEKHKTFRSDYV